MSIQDPYQVDPFEPEEDDHIQWLADHRDALEFEAQSDACDAWVFQRLLGYLDSAEGSSS